MANQLATLIRDHRAEILAEWEASVRTLASAADTGRSDLLNHLPRLLDWLAGRLAADEAPDTERDAIARRHALERLAQSFDVVELVSELALLRECVLGAWEAEPDGIRPAEIRQMDAEIDHVVALCVVEYARRAAAEADPLGAPAAGGP